MRAVVVVVLVVVWWRCSDAKQPRCQAVGGTCRMSTKVTPSTCQELDASCGRRNNVKCCKRDPQNRVARKKRRKCKPRRKCTKLGGACIKKKDECSGTVNEYACKGFSCKCCVQSCDCGVANNAKIVGGEEVKPNQFPWQVGLLYDDFEGYKCGGAIINSRYILTAAHCVDFVVEVKTLSVGVADHDQTSTSDDTDVTQVVKVKKVIVHEDWDPLSATNDIALLKLNTPLDLSSSSALGAVCLPSDPDKSYEGFTSTAMGWGDDEYEGDPEDKLQSVDLPIVDCEGDVIDGQIVTSDMICAGLKEGGKDACHGDSGGPLVVKEDGKYEIVGIVSFGEECALPEIPGVFTRVTSYLDWIAANTKGATGCT